MLAATGLGRLAGQHLLEMAARQPCPRCLKKNARASSSLHAGQARDRFTRIERKSRDRLVEFRVAGLRGPAMARAVLRWRPCRPRSAEAMSLTSCRVARRRWSCTDRAVGGGGEEPGTATPRNRRFRPRSIVSGHRLEIFRSLQGGKRRRGWRPIRVCRKGAESRFCPRKNEWRRPKPPPRQTGSLRAAAVKGGSGLRPVRFRKPPASEQALKPALFAPNAPTIRLRNRLRQQSAATLPW